MEEAEILQLYELCYGDLILLSPDSTSTISSIDEPESNRLESISRTLMETLGPSGPGLLSITGVPNVSNLRHTLLPLARKLALLKHDVLTPLLKKHGLGSDVSLTNTNRNVSSFAMQLKYLHSITLDQNWSILEKDSKYLKEDLLGVDRLENFHNDEFQDLGSNFKKLELCMIELGLRVARVCDRAIGGQELEQSILESGTAKGRLIHYHSKFDNMVLKEPQRMRKGINKMSRNMTENQATSRLWQQWHYDYGTFTVLTDPLFTLPCQSQTTRAKDEGCETQECPTTSEHTYLQILNKNKIQIVKSARDSFIIQVGESADILSKGKLCSTLHSVCRPENLENLSRETFVVFLQPAWSKSFSISDYQIEQSSEACDNDAQITDRKPSRLNQEIMKIIPPLSSRIKDGMTFAEFSLETTKQYYGDHGLQSNR